MRFRRLIFANLFRKKIRLILTVGSFAIALVLFTFLAVVKSADDARWSVAVCMSLLPALVAWLAGRIGQWARPS